MPRLRGPGAVNRVADERSRSSARVRNSFKSRRVQRSTLHLPSWSDRKPRPDRHHGRLSCSRRDQIAALATRHTGPDDLRSARMCATAGRLVSYAADLAGAYRQIGVYFVRILKGEKPAVAPRSDRSKYSHPTSRRLLVCARPLRPGRNGAEQSNEFAPSHCPSGRHLRRSMCLRLEQFNREASTHLD